MLNYYNLISDAEYERALSNGIDKDTYRFRIARGWDRERAMTEPKHERKSPYCKKIVELAESNGIERATLYTRVMLCGMSPYKGATTPKKVRNKTKYDDPMVRASCIENGISKELFLSRVNCGKWTVERAMTEPKHLRNGVY